MLRSVVIIIVILNSAISDEDDVINDEDIADQTYDAQLEPQFVEVVKEVPPQQKVFDKFIDLPKLTEEELSMNNRIPSDRFKCDICHIIVFNLGTGFKAEESKLPQRYKSKGIDAVTVIDIFEDVCVMDKFYGHYSVFTVEDEPKLCGPAFPDRKGLGMLYKHGPWPKRYRSYCGGILEDYEEDEVYNHYRSGNLFTELCMKGDCKGKLSEIPEAVDFKPFSKDEL